MANGTNAPLHLTRVTARCGTGKHGWCIGRVYSWPEEAPPARIVDCECGCGCSPRVAVTRPGPARTRTRQLAARAARRKPRAAKPDAG
jgi:hypothetical protein